MFNNNHRKLSVSIISILMVMITLAMSVFAEGKTTQQNSAIKLSAENTAPLVSALPTPSMPATTTPDPSSGTPGPASGKMYSCWSYEKVQGGIRIDGYVQKRRLKDGTIIVHPKITKYILPEEIDGKKVVEFCPDFNFANAKTFVIPKTIKRIIPDEDGCYFSENDKLQNIIVDKKNKVYKSYKGALVNKKTKTMLELPYRSKVKSFSVPKGVKKIGYYAFTCKNIKKIKLDNDVKSANHVYSQALRYLFVGGKITSVQANNFGQPKHLKKVVLGSSVKSVASGAFDKCSNLKKALVPKSTYIAPNAFPSTCKVIRK